MTIKELIESLQTLPLEEEIRVFVQCEDDFLDVWDVHRNSKNGTYITLG